MDSVNDVLREAESRFDGVSFGPAIEVAIDKSPLSTRTTLMPELVDRVAYQAAVAAIAPQIDQQTESVVYSARLSTDPRYFTKHGVRQWVAWRREVLANLTPGHEWMVKADLTSYFDLITHGTLNSEIQSLNPPPAVANALSEVLRSWSTVPGISIPQGPNASRLLGNLYLHPVDRAMLREGYRYFRFMDDIRIVCRTKGEAIRALRMFEVECRALGLVVSGAKTELLFGDAARRDLGPNSDLEMAQYFLDARAGVLARRLLKRILKRSLRASGLSDARGAKFSLWRLAQLREASVLTRVLTRLEDLAPIASIVAAYLVEFTHRPRVQAAIADFLADGDRSQSHVLETWLLSSVLEMRKGSVMPALIDQAVLRARDRNLPSYLRAVAALVVARGGRARDLAWIKSDLQRESDSHVLRGYAVALHLAGELDRTTQRRLINRDRRLRHTIDYLSGRSRIRSLVYRERHLVAWGN